MVTDFSRREFMALGVGAAITPLLPQFLSVAQSKGSPVTMKVGDPGWEQWSVFREDSWDCLNRLEFVYQVNITDGWVDMYVHERDHASALMLHGPLPDGINVAPVLYRYNSETLMLVSRYGEWYSNWHVEFMRGRRWVTRAHRMSHSKIEWDNEVKMWRMNPPVMLMGTLYDKK